MPLIKEAYPKNDMPVSGMYIFSDKNREGWKVFWNEMRGNKEKILKWATEANIEIPEEWYSNLHIFLFNNYGGDTSLFVRAAKQTFSAFLKQTNENHVNNPKDTRWYLDKGLTQRQYLSMVQNAAEIEKQNRAIAYMNGRVPAIGNEMYDEYLLSLTGWKWETEKKASELNKKAYEIEGGTFYDVFRKGDFIADMRHSSEHMKVEAVIDKGILAVKENGTYAYFLEPWNLQKI